ncbi:GNAT family N-acetyltransferase [Novosphingopyxis baekryungensis]|uniref:GNAT family N-acetyltransferase n=1 Tax=Novosphingopyxis baekryungensis TaxID=279369 RepID=UPI0003B44D88|nr:GNAT family N-acetyltransferase [Novosphingopyxis baekryungensis]
MAEDRIMAQIAKGVADLPAGQWDACNPSGNPFTGHAFLSAMEQSGSVGPGSGWSPASIVIKDAGGALAAALPAYLKSHSQGEYVFDQSWAHAFESAGGRYYPKLQIAAPFSPVPGPRLLLRDDALAAPLLQAAETLVLQNGLSSAHASFVAPDQIALFEEAGWLIRTDSQFHWKNRDYADFDGFLAALSSRKRKNIRKERAAAQGAVRIERFTGDAIRAEHWDAFWLFYQDTGARKWGTPYLTRQAFDLLGQRLGDRIVLVLAFDGDQPIAGALNLLGPDTIYGRYWGALMDVPFLHFELCYYQAIDIAIERGLATVEAGAQGQHKLARGYEPTPTYSAHFIADEGFRDAVDDFLLRERQAVAQEIEFLNDMGPFRKGS